MTAVLGAVLVIAAFGGAGFLLAAEKRRAFLRTEGYLLLVGHISARLPSLITMERIIAEFENPALEKSGDLRILKGENSIEPFNRRLLAAAETQRDDAALYSAICSVATELGSTDYDRQRKSLEAAHVRLTELYETQKAALEGGEKCYRWLGVLAGMLTVILLL